MKAKAILGTALLLGAAVGATWGSVPTAYSAPAAATLTSPVADTAPASAAQAAASVYYAG